MPVLINPNRPLSLGDFAQLYTGNGMTPDQNANDLFMNAPTEGRSYMEDQWAKLNTGTSPERYFADPSHVAAQLAASPSVRVQPQADALGRIPVSGGATGHDQWPMYSSESARNTAMNLGIDARGSYTTPTKMLEAVTSHLRDVPHDPQHLLNDPQLKDLIQQDPDKAKFVYSQLTNGGNFEHDRAEADNRVYAESKLNEARTYEEKQNAAHTQDARVYAESKLNEARTYEEKQMVLRGIAQEAQKRQEEQLKFQRAPMEFGIKTVQDLISRGAHFDPNTGQLSTWQNVEPDAKDIMPGGDNRPVRKRVPATPEEKHIWEHYYPFAMGMPAPHAPPVDPALAASREAAMSGSTDMQSKMAAALKTAEQLRGAPLNPAQIQAVVSKVQEENRPLFVPSEGAGTFGTPMDDSRFGDFAQAAYAGATGYQDTPLWRTNNPNAPRNWIGRNIYDPIIEAAKHAAPPVMSR